MTIGTNSIADWTRQPSDWTVLVDGEEGRIWIWFLGGGGRGPGGGGAPDPSAVLKAISETDVRG